MVDIVTGENEALYREAFCVSTGHSIECVNETVTTMGKVMASVCKATNTNSLPQIIENMEIEVFDHHLREILKQKKCDCNS